jgi:hypothetical protein
MPDIKGGSAVRCHKSFETIPLTGDQSHVRAGWTGIVTSEVNGFLCIGIGPYDRGTLGPNPFAEDQFTMQVWMRPDMVHQHWERL